jgi:hypothetical protein
MNSDFEPTLTQEQPAPAPAVAPQVGLRPARSFFWPGFVVGFVLLNLVSCGGLFVVTGLNRIDLADIQGSGSGWTPPTETLTSAGTPPEAPPGGNETGSFQLGETVRNVTSGRVNIRQSPGHLGKAEGDILAQLQPGDRLQIVAGPAPADNLFWWLIRYTTQDGRSLEGWVAEATSSGVQILGR